MFSVIFPGQGSQMVGMGKEFYDRFDLVKNLFKEADDTLNFSMSKLILEGPKEELDLTANTQPAIFLISYSIYNVIKKEFNIDLSKAKYFAGHSLGEYSALVAANSISIVDALKLVRRRGELMELAPSGSMSAIMGLDQGMIAEICSTSSKDESSHVQCANLNSPNQTVISGHDDAVERAQDLCIANGAKRSIKLKVSIASHSSLMLDAAEKFKQSLNDVEFNMPNTKIIHNVTVDSVLSPMDIPPLLISQLHSPVRWVETCDLISTLNLPIIECGPGKVLSGLFKANKLDSYYSVSEEDFYEKMNHYG